MNIEFREPFICDILKRHCLMEFKVQKAIKNIISYEFIAICTSDWGPTFGVEKRAYPPEKKQQRWK